MKEREREIVEIKGKMRKVKERMSKGLNPFRRLSEEEEKAAKEYKELEKELKEVVEKKEKE